MPSELFTGNDPSQLLSSLCAELRRRLLAGEDCRAELFLSAHPFLASHPQLALRLIESEIAARQERGETVNTGELLARFPQWREHLLARLGGAGFDVEPSHPTARSCNTDVYDAAAPARTPEVPELGPHALGEELARGGMGVVYHARDLVLGREVALKRIRPELVDSPESVQRFYREAHAAANLRHPNIVPIYHLGRHQGSHCFTMPLLTGGSLAQRLGRFRGDLRSAVVLMEKVARAVAAAHAEKIIHRDLKPANILLDETGEPLVADFGLAKVQDGHADVTLPGQRMGTAAYMSPEQAAGHSWKVTPASDVWSLGVILYELLAGQRPFPARNAEEAACQVLTAEVRRPRELRQEVPRDLDAVVMRCLQREPSERYADAGELAEDLRCWLQGQPVAARREPWLNWLRRQARRQWRYVAVLGFILLLLAAFYARPFLSSDWRLHDGQQRLAQGEPVVLIGPTGLPKWFRWHVKEGSFVHSERSDLPCMVSSVDPCFLELFRGAPIPAYRFSADIRLADQFPGSEEMGLLLAHRQIAWGGGNHDFCYTWAVARNDLSRPPVWTTRGTFRRYSPQHNRVLPGELREHLRGDVKQETFHSIAIEVDAKEVRFFWEGRLIETRPWHEFPDGFEHVRRWNDRGTDIDEFPGCLSPFDAQGGLGLYVQRGTASFQNVVLEPLR
jgi:serine/threonine-protein kinase